MIKKRLVATTILLMTVFVVSGDRLVFIGYDGQIPILKYAIYRNLHGDHQADSCIYRFANGKLMNANISIPNGMECLLTKNGVYVFKDTLDRFQIKRNGENIIHQFSLKLKWAWDVGAVAMNDKHLFIIAGRNNDSSAIFRVNYRTLDRIDTLWINGICTVLLDATNDYLYYSAESPNAMGPVGNVYQQNIRDGAVKIILKNVYTLPEAIAIAPQANLIYTSVDAFYGIQAIIANYNYDKSVYTVSQYDKKHNDAGVFYSYEHSAFISYQYSQDINQWKCLYPNETVEWKPLTNQPLNVMKEKPTGPNYKKGCITETKRQ
jgi:hypothetical protein